jgi:hypothetical protein
VRREVDSFGASACCSSVLCQSVGRVGSIVLGCRVCGSGSRLIRCVGVRVAQCRVSRWARVGSIVFGRLRWVVVFVKREVDSFGASACVSGVRVGRLARGENGWRRFEWHDCQQGFL